MNNLSKYGLTKVKPIPKKKSFLKSLQSIHFAEIPFFITIGIVAIGHVIYGMYVWSDEVDPEKNKSLKYVPFRSEYTTFLRGLQNLRKRITTSNSKDRKSSV